MPEAPDLHVFADNLHSLFANQKLRKIKLLNARSSKDTQADLKKNLDGQVLKKIYREGKELRFLFSNDVVLGMHLMQNGELFIFDDSNGHKKTVVEFYFGNGKGLALTDWRAQANIKLNPINKAGVDALSADLNKDYLGEQLQRRKKIKTLLTDQDVIRGIGNAYVDEILWKAGIHPDSVSKAIPANKVKDLAGAIRKVLKNAIDHIAKNHPDVINGEVRDFLLIHNPKAKKSPTGFPIKSDKKGNSTTYYTEEQELFK